MHFIAFQQTYLYTKSTRWRGVTGTCTPAVVRCNHDNTTMSSDGLGPDFNRSYLDRASKAARLAAAASWRYSEEPHRDPRAQFWRLRLVKTTNKQTKRDEKTDSKLFNPALQVAPTISRSRSQDAQLLSALPAAVHANSFEGSFVKDEPVHEIT
jgi:hypothetical protein